jgi:hypothetical protein
MKLRILRSALDDLANGREFYNQQREGVGDYFFDSLVSEIDSLVLYAGIHRVQFGYYRLLSRRFPVGRLLSSSQGRSSRLSGA